MATVAVGSTATDEGEERSLVGHQDTPMPGSTATDEGEERVPAVDKRSSLQPGLRTSGRVLPSSSRLQMVWARGPHPLVDLSPILLDKAHAVETARDDPVQPFLGTSEPSVVRVHAHGGCSSNELVVLRIRHHLFVACCRLLDESGELGGAIANGVVLCETEHQRQERRHSHREVVYQCQAVVTGQQLGNPIAV